MHSNGFSLVRKLVSVHGLDWEAQAPFSTGGSAYSRLCDVILEPTRIYVKALLPLLGPHRVLLQRNEPPKQRRRRLFAFLVAVADLGGGICDRSVAVGQRLPSGL